MENMKYLAAAATVTLVAGSIPLVALTSPVGVVVSEVSIALSAIALIVTMSLYFINESASTFTLSEKACR